MLLLMCLELCTVADKPVQAKEVDFLIFARLAPSIKYVVRLNLRNMVSMSLAGHEHTWQRQAYQVTYVNVCDILQRVSNQRFAISQNTQRLTFANCGF